MIIIRRKILKRIDHLFLRDFFCAFDKIELLKCLIKIYIIQILQTLKLKIKTELKK